MGKRIPLMERIEEKIERVPSGCWEWHGALSGTGYSRIKINRSNKSAHRVLYELLNGIIPDGLVLDHLCRNIRCVNPDHLEPVTHQENCKRGLHPSRTHCINGHPRTSENTYLNSRSSGKVHKTCKICTLAGRVKRKLYVV